MSAVPPQEECMVDKNSLPTSDARTKVQDEDLLDLWKYFQDRADMLKERQWTVGTWILTLLSGNIAFALSQETISFTQAGIVVSKSLPALILGVMGIVIGFYGYQVIHSYRHHIQRNWARAGQVKCRIEDLDFYWKAGLSGQEAGGQKSTDESLYLIRIIVGFLILYILMSFVSFFALLKMGASP